MAQLTVGLLCSVINDAEAVNELLLPADIQPSVPLYNTVQDGTPSSGAVDAIQKYLRHFADDRGAICKLTQFLDALRCRANALKQVDLLEKSKT